MSPVLTLAEGYGSDTDLWEAKTHLARDLWPVELPKLGTEHRGLHEMPDRQVIPSDVTEVFNRTSVVREEDPYGPGPIFKLVYKLPNLNGEKNKGDFEFRLQGFVLRANVTALGSWKPRSVYFLFVLKWGIILTLLCVGTAWKVPNMPGSS